MHFSGGRKPAFTRTKLLAAAMLAITCLFATAPVASAETRTLKLYFIHTKERAEITYKRNGRYIQSGLTEVNRFLRDWRRNEPTKMDPQLLDLLWEVYRSAGGRDYINVVSAYRSPKTNAMLRSRSGGVAKKSQHMLGKAIDFYIPGVKLATLRAAALKFQAGGVGYYPRSGSPFVHLDVGGVRHWPRMNRKQLLAVFPDGKTLHVPTDGKPLPGYKQALASYESRKRRGGSIQIARDDTRRGGGLLAALFGGGADDEEDTAETQVAAAPKAAPQAVKAPAPEPEPVKPDPTPATIIAALPRRDLPVPTSAPRPDIAVGTALPFEVKPVPSADDVPVGADEAPAPVAPVAEPMLVALNVPLPTRRPNYAPPAIADTVEQTPVQVASADTAGATDAIAEVLARSDASDDVVVTAAYLPVPSRRPLARQADEDTLAVAALPETRPVALMRDREAEAPGTQAPQERLARLTDKDKDVEAKPTAAPVVAMVSNIRSTGKAAKPGPDDLQPDAKPVVVPVETAKVHRALSHESVVNHVQKTQIPAFDAEIMRSPNTVYTGGFQQGTVVADAQRFTGKAVEFLSVAKFRTN